jgi:hypothetical protein
VAVIHDIAFEHYPEICAVFNSRFTIVSSFPVLQNMLRLHRHCVGVFEAGYCEALPVCKPDKIDVVYSAAKDFFAPVSESSKRADQGRVLQWQRVSAVCRFGEWKKKRKRICCWRLSCI